MKNKIWVYRNKGLSRQKIEDLSKKYSIPMAVATILLNRGIEESEFEVFLKKSLKNIINPFDMLDMDKAVERILYAIENHEEIVIYGDYDVDGITSTTLLFDFLVSRGADVSYYIPDRGDEGYGINIMAVNRLLKKGVRLLITVDCGITAIGEVEFAALSGMDVIITDHHTCKERIPSAAKAILNPKREDDDYSFKALAGVGVAFKLMLALVIKLGLNTSEYFDKYIDLTALGTIADVVELKGENRIIADRGVRAVEKSKRCGLQALLQVSCCAEKQLSAGIIAFSIAPRLNAAGRLGTASDAVELLLSKNYDDALKAAQQLDAENTERRITEQNICDEAMNMLAADVNLEKKKVIVLAHSDWHTGVIGIVASRICEQMHKPCILISLKDGFGKGSGRSIEGFNLFEALKACEKYLPEFGGHSAAAGLSINSADVEEFDKVINKYADSVLSESDMIPKLKIDCRLSEKSVNLHNAKMLKMLEPFGVGNEKPVFSLSAVRIDKILRIGSDNKHLRIAVSKNGINFAGVGFSMGEYAEKFHSGDIVDIAFVMDINNFKNNETVQLLVKDIIKTGKELNYG